MKAKSVLLLLFAAMVFLSCKDNKEQSTPNEPAAVAQDIFKVTLNVVAAKDDDFSLFYKEDGATDFAEPIWTSVKGNDAAQDVVYTLPADVFPTTLRLDVGRKENQEQIVLKSVTLEYNGKKRTFNGSEIGNFFRADENKCTFDASTGVIKAVVKDGVKQFPSLYPHDVPLRTEIEKLAQ